MKKTRLTMRDEKHLSDTLKRLSREHGGAWVASRRGFSFDFDFTRYQNPSSVPDWAYDLSRREMGYKGKIRGFTPSAIRREGLRAYSRT